MERQGKERMERRKFIRRKRNNQDVKTFRTPNRGEERERTRKFGRREQPLEGNKNRRISVAGDGDCS